MGNPLKDAICATIIVEKLSRIFIGRERECSGIFRKVKGRL